MKKRNAKMLKIASRINHVPIKIKQKSPIKKGVEFFLNYARVHSLWREQLEKNNKNRIFIIIFMVIF